MIEIGRGANGSAIVWSYKSYIVKPVVAVDVANASQRVIIAQKYEQGRMFATARPNDPECRPRSGRVENRGEGR